jgi:hypothetical protein
MIIDIHDRKQAEESLRQQEVLLRAQNDTPAPSLCGNFRFGDIIGKSTIMHASIARY